MEWKVGREKSFQTALKLGEQPQNPDVPEHGNMVHLAPPALTVKERRMKCRVAFAVIRVTISGRKCGIVCHGRLL